MKSKLKDAYILDGFTPYVEALKKQLVKSDEFDHVWSFTSEDDLIQVLKQADESKMPYLFLEYYLKDKNLDSVFTKIKTSVRKAKIIVISTITNPSLLSTLLRFKPDAIVHKADKPQDIISCVENLREDKVFYSGIILQILQRDQKTKNSRVFTPREKELLNFWARGYTVEKTAEVLSLSFHTVVAHRRNMFKKANSKSLSELLSYAKRKKLIN